MLWCCCVLFLPLLLLETESCISLLCRKFTGIQAGWAKYCHWTSKCFHSILLQQSILDLHPSLFIQWLDKASGPVCNDACISVCVCGFCRQLQYHSGVFKLTVAWHFLRPPPESFLSFFFCPFFHSLVHCFVLLSLSFVLKKQHFTLETTVKNVGICLCALINFKHVFLWKSVIRG